MEATDTTYNGWSNYPTWAVNLWLSNDEPLYRATLEMIEVARQTAIDCESILSNADLWRITVADVLRQWVSDELAPDLGATFAADLLGYALGCVDWHEIAESWIGDHAEQTG